MRKAAHAPLVLVALASLPLRAEAADKGTRFWNLAVKAVTHLQLALAGSSEFGPDQAANDPDGTVDPDERVRITGLETGRYDLRITYRGGQTCLAKDVAVEKGKVFLVHAKALMDCAE